MSGIAGIHLDMEGFVIMQVDDFVYLFILGTHIAPSIYIYIVHLHNIEYILG